MDTQEKIERIKAWNESFITHELTCGKMFCSGAVMQPKMSPYKKDTVVLVCPHCHRVQEEIPEPCFSMSVGEIREAEDRMIERFPKMAENRKDE